MRGKSQLLIFVLELAPEFFLGGCNFLLLMFIFFIIHYLLDVDDE